MIRRTLLAFLVVVAAIPAAAGELRVLERGIKPVVSAFNDAADRVRFLAILSPT